MESTPGNWTRIALAVLLASAPAIGFAKARSDVDARHCLDLGSDAAIIQCAEQFRPGGPRSSGKMRRQAATPAAAAPASAPAAPDAPAPVTQPAAGTPGPAAGSAPAPAPKRRGRKQEADARHCLDLGDFRKIARCAEKYR